MKTMEKIEIVESPLSLNLQEYAIRVQGISSLIVHAWDPKAKQIMLDRQMKKTVVKEIRDPENEYQTSLYKLVGGGYGFPLTNFKQTIVSCGDKDLDKNLAKTKLRQAFFIQADGYTADDIPCVRLLDPKDFKSDASPRMREDMVKINGGKSADIRYRGEFREWGVILRVELNENRLSLNQLINLLMLGGHGIGVGEWRPERDGDYGRFKLAGYEAMGA